MKKIYWLLVLLLFITSGCTLYNIDRVTYDEIINDVLTNKKAIGNTPMEGYKFYLPRTFKIYNKKNTNLVLYSLGKKYYLYVDLVSYYNKVLNNYEFNNITDSIIYSRKIMDNDKTTGYVLITSLGEKVYLQVVYNSGKIEVVSTLPNVKKDIYNSLVLLKSINYKDEIVKVLVGNKTQVEKEEEYDILGPANSSSSKFLEYLTDYEDVDNELPDDDQLDIE